MMQKLEELYGSAATYAAAVTNAGVAGWFEQHWFLVLSVIAVMIRIGIDLPKLYEIWKKRK